MITFVFLSHFLFTLPFPSKGGEHYLFRWWVHYFLRGGIWVV